MEMRRDGLFDSSLLYYIYKMSTTLMICLFSAWLVAAHSEDTYNHFAARCWGGILMGIFFQQSGWLCHEICHHQCFKNRIHGKFLGYFWGNCAQGFSVAWWTNKHCTHHAVAPSWKFFFGFRISRAASRTQSNSSPSGPPPSAFNPPPSYDE